MNDAGPVQRVETLPVAEELVITTLDDQLDPGGFLRRRSRRLTLSRTGAGAKASEAFVYDEVTRRAIDAVVVVPFFRENDMVRVVLRTALRPPVALRQPIPPALPASALLPLWEVPAGLVEPSESHATGLREAASRELLEETGFRVSPQALIELGPPAFPCPGVLGECHFFFAAEVTMSERSKPELDGSPLEEFFELCAIPLSGALAAAREGNLRDSKSELALRRLAEVLR
jgi:ADP-ribose pyrophosphatase